MIPATTMADEPIPPARRREIVSAVLTLAAAVGLVGVVFGVGCVAAGASVAQTCVMSLLVFTGASQFSLVSEVASGSTGAAALGGAVEHGPHEPLCGVDLCTLRVPGHRSSADLAPASSVPPAEAEA